MRRTNAAPDALSHRDYLLLGLVAVTLFGYSTISGRPLTMHEARLPQTAREMKANGDWLLPTSGGRPWLERPPLPHWCVIGVEKLVGCDQAVWVVRLPSALMGTATVLIAAWVAGRWFGRDIGRLTGLLLVTMLEFFQYSSLAEDDIYFGFIATACIAVFCRVEWDCRGTGESSNGRSQVQLHRVSSRPNLTGPRSLDVGAFFFLLGLTNWVRGPLLGPAIIGSAVGWFLVWNGQRDQLLRYVWLPGWILAAGLTLAWPWYAWRLYPDVVDNWRIDYFGRLSGANQAINQHWYYYIFQALPQATLPWTALCLVGLFATSFDAWEKRGSAERFIWCWAIVPVLVLSIPRGKHHHYLVPILAPWAILAAVGMRRIGRSILRWRPPLGAGLSLLSCAFAVAPAMAIVALRTQIPGPLPVTIALAVAWVGLAAIFLSGLYRRRGDLLMAALILTIGVVLCWGETFVAGLTDYTLDDTAFMRRANGEVPPATPFYINSDIGTIDFFRLQFYARADAHLLHNLSFLRARDITAPLVYVVTRANDEAKLARLGAVEQVDRSSRSHGDAGSAVGRFTLFRLTFEPNLVRYDRPRTITTMQALARAPGPFCGGPL
jgi:4-amino-4-deoxy-L-arabinose transferase-like glycosyltransferase